MAVFIIMAGQEMISFLQFTLVATIVLFSIFLNKLYKARSFVRQLQRQGFVCEKPATSVIGYLAM